MITLFKYYINGRLYYLLITFCMFCQISVSLIIFLKIEIFWCKIVKNNNYIVYRSKAMLSDLATEYLQNVFYLQNLFLVSAEKLVIYSRLQLELDHDLIHTPIIISLQCCNPCSSAILYVVPSGLITDELYIKGSQSNKPVIHKTSKLFLDFSKFYSKKITKTWCANGFEFQQMLHPLNICEYTFV